MQTRLHITLILSMQWADSVRDETAYKWSAPFHFVDANGALCCPLFSVCKHSHAAGDRQPADVLLRRADA